MTSRSTKPAVEHALHWLLLIVALVAALALVGRGQQRSPTTRARVDPLLAVPAGPELLLSADVERLVAVAASEVLRVGGSKLLGLREQCGFEPLLALRRVVFAMPARVGSERSDFALIAETSLQMEPVLRCAESVIRKRGGKPVRSRLGQFDSVRDQAKPVGEVAIRSDGLFVLSGGQYLRDVVDAAGGAALADEARRLRTQLHLSIRGKLGAAQLALTLLPGDFLAVPGVQAVGLGLDVGREVTLRGFVGCLSQTACAGARELLEAVTAELAREPGLDRIDAVQLTQRQGQLEIEGRLPRHQFAALLERLLASE